MVLYSYTLTHDTGFAPNPFENYCTLATCKAKMRKSIGENYRKRAENGEDIWVIGWAGKKLIADMIDQRLIQKILDKVTNTTSKIQKSISLYEQVKFQYPCLHRKISENLECAPNKFDSIIEDPQISHGKTRYDLKKNIKKSKLLRGKITDIKNQILEKVYPHSDPRNENGFQYLIFGMRITDIVTSKEYWDQYEEKRPDSSPYQKWVGDNIYEPISGSNNRLIKFRQHPSMHRCGAISDWTHFIDDLLISQFVLISSDYYYFGMNAPQIPYDRRKEMIHKRGYKKIIKFNEGKNLSEWLNIEDKKTGIFGWPSEFPDHQPWSVDRESMELSLVSTNMPFNK